MLCSLYHAIYKQNLMAFNMGSSGVSLSNIAYTLFLYIQNILHSFYVRCEFFSFASENFCFEYDIMWATQIKDHDFDANKMQIDRMTEKIFDVFQFPTLGCRFDRNFVSLIIIYIRNMRKYFDIEHRNTFWINSLVF